MIRFTLIQDMDTSREIEQFLHYNPLSTRKEIATGVAFDGSDATLKRTLSALVGSGDIVVDGKARSTRYSLSPRSLLMMPLNLDTYFAQDIDERKIQTSFNFKLIRETLSDISLFTDEEKNRLFCMIAKNYGIV